MTVSGSVPPTDPLRHNATGAPAGAYIRRSGRTKLHQTTGRWRLGLALTLGSVAMWATLPIALKLLLRGMDAYTITWYRFAMAAIALGVWLALKRALPRPDRLSRTSLALLTVAVLGLTGNYLFYVIGLELVSPATAQVVIQLAPMFLLLGGLAVFRESFGAVQWSGLVLVIAGLGLFFHDRLDTLSPARAHGLGVAIVTLAAVLWAAYALAQKQLLGAMSSPAIMCTIYVFASVLLLPVSEPTRIGALDGMEFAMLAFGCVNTLIAYGCFSEALNHWEASRVGAVLAVTPLLTIVSMMLLEAAAPGLFAPEPIDAISMLGALVVVAGSAMTALARR